MRCVTTVLKPLTDGLCGMGRHGRSDIHHKAGILLPVMSLLLILIVRHWNVIKAFVCGRVALGGE